LRVVSLWSSTSVAVLGVCVFLLAAYLILSNFHTLLFRSFFFARLSQNKIDKSPKPGHGAMMLVVATNLGVEMAPFADHLFALIVADKIPAKTVCVRVGVWECVFRVRFVCACVCLCVCVCYTRVCDCVCVCGGFFLSSLQFFSRQCTFFLGQLLRFSAHSLRGVVFALTHHQPSDSLLL
jgi:hypothetical protein